MRYIIGDIHGCFTAFAQLLKKIRTEDEEGCFLLVGDIVDRGPEVREMIGWALEHVTEDGTYQMIRGNHEQLAIDWYRQTFLPWYEGGRLGAIPDSRFQFSQDMQKFGWADPEVLKEIVEFFESLPYYKVLQWEGQQYVVTHAYAKPDEMQKIEEGESPEAFRRTFLWDRTHCGAGVIDGYKIIHGHTPVQAEEYLVHGGEPGKIGHRPSTVNVDCGYCYGTQYGPASLAAYCIETKQEFYIPVELDSMGDSDSSR